ncbi:MAG: glycerol-3-phosphate acyltransferase [Acidimicrobiia bacterium]|nr:glycerol-3-phosphate acyltransferase [Acidimicrobiia bacterium]
MWATLLLLPLAYALGMFPSAVLVARVKGHDILSEGSGNPGASNVIRVLGWRAGALVMAMDFAKGAAAAGVGLGVAGRAGAFALGAAAILGHTFPLLRRGGKGVAAAGGMLVVLYPLIAVGVGVVWFVVARLLRKASLASILATTASPVLVAAAGYGIRETAVIAVLSGFVIVRHSGNIRRLIRHEEADLSAPPRGRRSDAA